VRALAPLDLAVITVYLVLIFLSGLALTRRAGESVESFFVGGRSLPWWLLGISMAATNFSIDTPIAITRLVLTEGISGVWFFWASAISALLVTFLFARLWRRSGVMTDAMVQWWAHKYADGGGKPRLDPRAFLLLGLGSLALVALAMRRPAA
jgi:Na+(H+)/acetate symporter ActP